MRHPRDGGWDVSLPALCPCPPPSDGIEGWKRDRRVIGRRVRQGPQPLAELEGLQCPGIGIDEPGMGDALPGIDAALGPLVELPNPAPRCPRRDAVPARTRSTSRRARPVHARRVRRFQRPGMARCRPPALISPARAWPGCSCHVSVSAGRISGSDVNPHFSVRRGKAH